MFKNVDVMAPFFAEPGREFHQRQLAKILKTSPATIKSKISPFVKEGVLKETNIRNALVYSPALDNLRFKRQLCEFNIKMLRKSGLVTYLENEFTFPAIVLFGSWAKGENRKGSDIDIFVIAEDKKKLDLSRFEKKLGGEIQIFLHSKREVDKMKINSPELLNNVINGIKLSGFMEIF